MCTNETKYRYTRPQDLNAEDIRFVTYWDGAFYVSEGEFKHPGDVSGTGCSRFLTFIGSPGWFAHDACKAIYEWLSERIDMTNWYPGEWMEIAAASQRTSTAASVLASEERTSEDSSASFEQFVRKNSNE